MAGVDLWKWGELEWVGTRERMESIISGVVVGIPLVHQLSRVLSLGVVGVVGEISWYLDRKWLMRVFQL